MREHTAELGGSAQLAGVSSFGVDASGEIYIVSYNRGVVLKIIGPPPTPGTLRIIRSGGVATVVRCGLAWQARSNVRWFSRPRRPGAPNC